MHILGAEKAGEARLEFLVQLLRAADEPHRRHAVTVFIQGAVRRRTHRSVVGEAQVVVGAQVNGLVARDLDDAALRTAQDPLLLIESLARKALEVGAQALNDSLVHGVQLYLRLHVRALVRRPPGSCAH